ncbi:MAG TPA: FAD binding domain-containing protein [Solirubrobacteraceae bacterium]|jgi:CO/xanthine dehydrogenase FAD-binding subunit|nr:FAD binding domain-containing protein [Solirubrobacteraceae bacterium]
MKPAPFVYTPAPSVAGALELLADEDATALAGGQSLVPLLNFRLARPGVLVDLNPLTALDHLHVTGGALRIGALTRQATLQRSATVAEGWPLLTEAVSHVGHAAIRNRGTVGGSVAHADPAAELPVALTALDARFHLRSGAGERTLSASELFQGPMTTALETGELLVEIEVPPVGPGARMAFLEHARTHGDFAVAGAAVVLVPGERAAIALLGAAVTPVRAHAAERALLGGAAAAEAARLAGADVGDDHRRALITTLTRRALERVLA